MKLIFIDETGQGDKFAISIIVVDSTKYGRFKREYLNILKKYNWDHKNDKNEFKGSCILNPPETCKLTLRQRIEMCYELLCIVQSKNAILKPYVAYHDLSKNNHQNKIGIYKQKLYFKSIPLILNKALKRYPVRDSKNVICIFCDDFCVAKENKTEYQEMREKIAAILKSKDLTFFEEIFFYQSTNYTIGLSYADIIGYLLLKKIEIQELKHIKEIERILGNIDKIVEKYDHTKIIKNIN